MTQEAVDFSSIITNIESYAPPDPDSDIDIDVDMLSPLKVPHTDRYADTLRDMMFGITRRDIDPDVCAFYMHPTAQERLSTEIRGSAGSSINLITQPSHSYLGRPIRLHRTIPKGRLLCFAPDAIGLGGQIYNPRTISYTPPEPDSDT